MKRELPKTVPHFWEGHSVTLAVTVASGLISALALGHHVQQALTWTGWTKDAAVILSCLFAFLTAMTPISLARAHGESMEGGNPQSALLIIVLMLMVVDGALQVHAVQYIVKSMGMAELAMWAVCLIAGLWQMAMFFVRGALTASQKEIRDIIAAREHHLREIEAHAKARKNAKRREKYAANVVSING
jgi:membrane-associated HD superfamily phosphohydrolase